LVIQEEEMKIFHPTFAIAVKYLLMLFGILLIGLLWIPTLGWSAAWVNKWGIAIWGKTKWEEE
jgi:hypothetical protein